MRSSLSNRRYSPLVLGATLLPATCLAWKWSQLPAQVPWHFSGRGGTTYGDKQVLLACVLVPLLLYLSGPLLLRDGQRRGLLAGAVLLVSAALCILILAQTTAS